MISWGSHSRSDEVIFQKLKCAQIWEISIVFFIHGIDKHPGGCCDVCLVLNATNTFCQSAKDMLLESLFKTKISWKQSRYKNIFTGWSPAPFMKWFGLLKNVRERFNSLFLALLLSFNICLSLIWYWVFCVFYIFGFDCESDNALFLIWVNKLIKSTHLLFCVSMIWIFLPHHA